MKVTKITNPNHSSNVFSTLEQALFKVFGIIQRTFNQKLNFTLTGYLGSLFLFFILMLSQQSWAQCPPPIPTVVTATPNATCLGNTVQLNALTTANFVAWYDAPSGGNLITATPSGVNAPVTPNASITYYAEAVVGTFVPPATQTFNVTGNVQTFVVPPYVTSITIQANGAQGGGEYGGGGLGAALEGTFAVTPGETLYIVVGEKGHLQIGGDYQASSGGGGGTFVYRSSTDLLLAAAGGGGRCNWTGAVPLHPDANGQAGVTGGNGSLPVYNIANLNGVPGTNGNPGTAGTWSNNIVTCTGGGTGWLSSAAGPYGGLGFGSWAGGVPFCYSGASGCGGYGGYGGGGGAGNLFGGGGGGGGYSGGAGGTDATHGGGGGSYNAGTSQTNISGIQTNDGFVSITYSVYNVVCVSTSRVPVAVTIDQPSTSAGSILSSAGIGFCGTGSTTLSAIGGSLGSNANWQWYEGSCNSASIGSGVSIPVTPSANTTYYVNAVSTTGYCPSTSCVNLDIFVNPSGIPSTPATITTTASPICQGGSTDLTTSSTGNMINWYDAPSGGTLLYTTFNSYPYTVLPTTTTTYYAEGVFGTYIPYQEFCTSLSRTPITIEVENPSIDPTGINSTNGVGFCGSANTLLSVQGGSLGSNADWFWYSGTCGGNYEGTGATLNVTPMVTTTYYVRAESASGTCGNSNCATVTIIVNAGGPPAAPSNVTATPANLCLGNQTQLDGTSIGNYVNWYDAPTGGNLLGTVPSGFPFSQTPNSSITYYAEAMVGAPGPLVTQTFNYSGVIDSWIVPNGVTSITVEAYGAQGGDCSSSNTQGAKMKGDFAVTPGQQIWILAGQFPQSSNYGGGGTFVATGPTVASSTPLVVAGGGGGSASNMGGSALAPTVNDGNPSYDGTLGGTLGNGSSSSNGGGGFYTAGSSGGSFVAGGNGGCAFGGGACGSGCSSYGGGGGGYSGGAGDYSGNGGGGGSFNSGTNQNNIAGYNNGYGYVTISYASLATVCTSLSRTPVSVTVDEPSVEPTSIVSSNGTGFCTVASTTLSLQGGSLGTNANWVWYSGTCGGTLEGTGPTLAIAPTSNTTYFVRAESSTGYCANTNCQQITITVSPLGPPAAPITASATPNLVCQGTLVQLEASAPGNFITWYDAAVGGNSLGSTLSSGQLPITPSSSASYYAEAVFGVFGSPVTETFYYSGAIVPWTVPANVTSITIEGFGAQGGECSYSNTQGARMKGDFNVTPGQQLWLLVGENPQGTNYGGGGTFVGTGSTLALSTPLLVAGGGGGSAYNMGSTALAPIGNDGNASYDGTPGGTLGNGSSSPNGGGGYYTSGTSGGSFVGGGYGGCAFGGGACGSGCSSYGGGGGGYSGGGSDLNGNGGGGGSFNIGTNQSNTPGDHSGHGLLTITYNTMQPICSSLTRTPVSVSVEQPTIMPTSLTSSLGNCGDGVSPTTLSVVGGTLGTNADWKWYTGSCGGNLVGSGPSLVVTPTVTTTYYLRSESTGPCPATSCDSITITLVEAPTSVTATPNVFCGAGPFVSQLNAVSTGNLISWYDVPSGGIPIAGGASVPSGSNVPVSVSATTTYYAEAQSIACSNNSLSNILSNLNTNATSISNTVPNPFNFAMDGGLNGTDITDGGNDMYDGGNILNTNFSNAFNYSDNTIISSSAFGTNGQFFTKKIDNMFVMAADLDGVTNFSITGNNGADGSGIADATSFPLTMGCTDYTVYLKRVHSAGDPSINQMIIIKNNPNVVHNFATNTDDSYQELTGLSGTTRMYYLLYAGDNGSIIDVVDYTNIATNFLTTVQANIGSTACVSNTRTPVTITVNPSCNTETLELTAFLQGYYTGASTMANVMAAQNYLPVPATNDVDDITVELHDATTFALVPGATVTTRLQSNGTAICAIPVQPGNYYVVCKHRNHIQTWSADPITFSGTPVPYNFSTSSTQAFAGNMIEVELGVWAFFSGDINQDEFVDGTDYPFFDYDSQNNVQGVYVATDLNGDGYVDGTDYPLFDANSQNNVQSIHP